MWSRAPCAESLAKYGLPVTELIDAQTDQTLWSDSFDRDLTDIFAIQK